MLSSGPDMGTASMRSLQLWKPAHNCTRVLWPKGQGRPEVESQTQQEEGKSASLCPGGESAMTVSHNFCIHHTLGDTWSLDLSPQEKGWCVGFTEAACEPHMELGSSVAVFELPKSS